MLLYLPAAFCAAMNSASRSLSVPMSAVVALTGKKSVSWATPGTSAGRAGTKGTPGTVGGVEVAGVGAVGGRAVGGVPGATAVGGEGGGGGLAGGGGDRGPAPLQEATTVCAQQVKDSIDPFIRGRSETVTTASDGRPQSLNKVQKVAGAQAAGSWLGGIPRSARSGHWCTVAGSHLACIWGQSGIRCRT